MKRHLRHPRDSGGAFTLNNPDDQSPIREMFELGDGLFIISDKCTYRIQLADQVDPERNNPTLAHHFQQKLFDHGFASPLLCRIFLQSKAMFRKEFQGIDIKDAMQASLEALGNLVSMEEIAQRFSASEKSAIEKTRNNGRDGSMTVPSVGNVRIECKSFCQKADHFPISLMDIVRLFYTDMAKRNWEDFRELAEKNYGKDDEFTKLLMRAAPFLKLIRDARDCLEHNLEGIRAFDFTPQADGSIALPTIELSFRNSTLQRCQVSGFIEEVIKAMQIYFEMIVVHVCSKTVKPFAGLPIEVGELSPEWQAAWGVRFSYGSYDHTGHFIPCG